MSRILDLQDQFDCIADKVEALITTTMIDKIFIDKEFSRLHFLLDIARENIEKMKEMHTNHVKEIDHVCK